MTWAKILPIQGETILIGSFYRPPDTDITPMDELKVFLSSFSQAKKFKNNVIIAGDFNFPSIIWEDGVGSIGGNPMYGREINNAFLDIINEFGLEQQVNECTRGNHILDIVLSS